MKQHDDILNQLEQILQQRKSASPDSSYVASLHHKGLDAILKKVGEEATETLLAAKGDDPQQVIYETADLWFHTLVMLSHLDISHQQILDELGRRFGLSGLDEKRARNQ